LIEWTLKVLSISNFYNNQLNARTLVNIDFMLIANPIYHGVLILKLSEKFI